ncbi:MAG TPA: ABC transporter substrate-binding protein [Chloroflexota bacterium]|nr:ABC transporter substrate-binding protein [Chloroflexota bacterium]
MKVIASLALGLLLAACGGAAAPASAPASASPTSAPASKPAASAPPSAAARAPLNPAVKVHVAYTGAAAESATFVGYDRGYFKDEGLDLDLIRIKTGQDALASVANGQIDVFASPPQAAIYNAIARSVDLKIVAYFQVTPPISKSLVIMVRQDLVDSGRYKEPKDFKGMNWGATSTNSLYTEKALAKGGLKTSDVNIITLGYPDMLVAFANKKLDAGQLVQPFGSQAEKKGLAKTVLIAGELLPGTPTTMLMFGPSFVKDQPEVAKRYMIGFIRAERDLYNAFDRNQGNKDDIYNLLVKYGDIKDPAQYAEVASEGQFNGTPPNGEMDVSGLETFQANFIANGLQKEPLDFSKAVDHSFADYAVQQLGRI